MPTSLRLLPLLMLACAGGAPAEYHDGARLPPPQPRTVYTPPGTGLPEYFAPPAPQRPPEPVPSRVLPETPETRRGPGIWAAHAPGSGAALRIADEPVPVSDEPDLVHGAKVAHSCAESMNAAIRASGEWGAVMRIGMALERPCIAARLYRYCTSSWYNLLVAASLKNALARSARMHDALLAAFIRADAWVAKACLQDDPSVESARITSAVKAAWDKENNNDRSIPTVP